MPRLFVANFEFEHRLAPGAVTLSTRLRRINAELACSWVAVAAEGDAILLPELIDDRFWETLAEAGLPHVRGVVTPDAAHDFTWTPWGWSPELRQGVPSTSLAAVPAIEVVRAMNSRRFSAELEAAWQIGLPAATAAMSLADVLRSVQDCGRVAAGWVIKAEFGMSGRERLLGRGPLDTAQERWVARRLTADGVVFVEPWVTPVAEAGLQFEIDRSEQITYVGLAEMLATRQGAYAGSCFTTPDAAPMWAVAREQATRAVAVMAERGYFGPVGIDAMLYRHADGSIGCRPLQDINARWTMGRLALGWRRIFPSATRGYWWHGSAENFAAETYWSDCGLSDTVGWQILRTSPEFVGSHPAWLTSALLVYVPQPAAPATESISESQCST